MFPEFIDSVWAGKATKMLLLFTSELPQGSWERGAAPRPPRRIPGAADQHGASAAPRGRLPQTVPPPPNTLSREACVPTCLLPSVSVSRRQAPPGFTQRGCARSLPRSCLGECTASRTEPGLPLHAPLGRISLQ